MKFIREKSSAFSWVLRKTGVQIGKHLSLSISYNLLTWIFANMPSFLKVPILTCLTAFENPTCCAFLWSTLALVLDYIRYLFLYFTYRRISNTYNPAIFPTYLGLDLRWNRGTSTKDNIWQFRQVIYLLTSSTY